MKDNQLQRSKYFTYSKNFSTTSKGIPPTGNQISVVFLVPVGLFGKEVVTVCFLYCPPSHNTNTTEVEVLLVV